MAVEVMRAPGAVLDSGAKAVEVASGSSYEEAASLTVPAGTWLLLGQVAYAANSNGSRYVQLKWGGATFSPSFPANSGTTTIRQVFRVEAFASAREVSVNARQNSGSSLSATGRLWAVRLA